MTSVAHTEQHGDHHDAHPPVANRSSRVDA
jgi:hypothetical protein